MSEKIKELIIKAGTDSSGKWMRVDQAETLAELIVKECLTAIDNTNKHHAHTTFDLGLIENTIAKSRESVKQHFGV